MLLEKSIAEVELDKFKNSQEGLSLYLDAKGKLIRSGIINLLRIFARPFTRDGGANPYTAAYMAAFTEGYNTALDDIIYFEELYLKEKLGRKSVPANFGALRIAMAKGDLTEKDLNGKR